MTETTHEDTLFLVSEDVSFIRKSLNGFARLATSILENSNSTDKEKVCEAIEWSQKDHLAQFKMRWTPIPEDKDEAVEFRFLLKKSDLEHLENLRRKVIEIEKIIDQKLGE